MRPFPDAEAASGKEQNLERDSAPGETLSAYLRHFNLASHPPPDRDEQTEVETKLIRKDTGKDIVEVGLCDRLSTTCLHQRVV